MVTLRKGAINVPVQFEIRDGNDLLTLTGYDSVKLYINGYASSPITATLISTGVVSVTFPSAFCAVTGEYKAYFGAFDNTTDFIPLGESFIIKVIDTWD